MSDEIKFSNPAHQEIFEKYGPELFLFDKVNLNIDPEYDHTWMGLSRVKLRDIDLNDPYNTKGTFPHIHPDIYRNEELRIAFQNILLRMVEEPGVNHAANDLRFFAAAVDNTGLTALFDNADTECMAVAQYSLTSKKTAYTDYNPSSFSLLELISKLPLFDRVFKKEAESCMQKNRHNKDTESKISSMKENVLKTNLDDTIDIITGIEEFDENPEVLQHRLNLKVTPLTDQHIGGKNLHLLKIAAYILGGNAIADCKGAYNRDFRIYKTDLHHYTEVRCKPVQCVPVKIEYNS